MQSVFTQILSMSLTASVVIALILIIRRFIRKMPKAFSYALWAVALFRLLCPVSIGSGLSLFGLVQREEPAPEPVTVTETEPIEPETIVPETDHILTREEYLEIYVPRMNLPYSVDVTNSAPAVIAPEPESIVEAEAETAIPAKHIDTMDVLMWVWLAGAGVMVIYGVVNWARLRLYLLGSVQAYDNVYIADHLSTAFVMGVVFPKIYLPSDIDPAQEAHIVAHERYHIRRLDHITRLLAYAALCLHWFNPLVWAAFVLSGRDMEMSCDEGVIRRLGEDKRGAYAASLLNFAAGRQIVSPVPVSFSEGDTKRRILNIAAMRQPKRWVSLLLAVACLAFTVACGADPKADPPKKPEAEAIQSGEPGQLTGEFSEEQSYTAGEFSGEASTDTAGAVTGQTGEPAETDTEKKDDSKAGQWGHEASLQSTPESPLIDTTLLYRGYNIFDHINSPYDFFQNVTEDDINYFGVDITVVNPDNKLNSKMVYSADIVPLFNAIGENEIVAVSGVEKRDLSFDGSDYYHDPNYDMYSNIYVKDGENKEVGAVYLFRIDGHIYMHVEADKIYHTNGGYSYNKQTYGGANCWEIKNDALTALFNQVYAEKYSDKVRQEWVLSLDEPAVCRGEDVDGYSFIVPKGTGKVLKLVVEVYAPPGVEMGYDVVEKWDSTNTVHRAISMPNQSDYWIDTNNPDNKAEDGGTIIRAEYLPASTTNPYNMESKGLDGCTVTFRLEAWH